MKKTTRTPRRAARPVARPAPSLATLRGTAAGAVEKILKQGAALQRTSRQLAVSTARQARQALVARAAEARTGTMAAATKLEKVFEQRVGRALSTLGVPSATEVRALSKQVARLQASVEQLRRSRARA